MPEMRHLKDKEARQVIKEFIQHYPSSEHSLRAASDFQELTVEGRSILFVDGRPLILKTNSNLLPSLKFDEIINELPKIVVDMGAVAHIANGAHIMRPGIREIRGDFSKGRLLAIVDEKFGKALALGTAEMDSEAMRSMNKGRVITNVHYVGDELWSSFAAKKPH